MEDSTTVLKEVTMKTLLKVQASLFGENGQSSQLANRFIERWRAKHPDGRVVVRDLNANPLPHLTAERFQAFTTKPTDRTPEQQSIVAESDALIAELSGAHTIVLAVPMYNFSVPSTVRAYFDHIARAGVTFRYTEKGPEGLIKGKKTFVFTTSGSAYADGAETQTPYLKQFLSFIGLDDITFIRAGGLALGEEARNRALTLAHASIESLTARQTLAA
jgi:FMN-dependent NADH-azoreductase